MDSFNPTVRCPHCDGVNRPSITGWGREGLNNRLHACKHCSQEYVVICLVDTSKEYKVSDMHISAMKARIEYQLEYIRDMEAKLVNKNRELAKEIIRLEASTGGKQN